jgi:eukaryotic-like serine/threonine-protein kinase
MNIGAELTSSCAANRAGAQAPACRSRGAGGEAEEAVVGSLLLDRFHVTRKLGSGGFGVVYRAWDERLERDVAIKVIEVRGEAGRRVLREAKAAARLNHPGIVTLYEFGQDERHAYLVSELVDGETLRELSLAGALSDLDVGESGADLCEALDHAHSRGVIHRDIKPQNVLIPDDDPQAKLMDFGIARVLDDAGLTATGDVVGTLAYMAPEQAEGEIAGPEADVYSLGLTLYECWSGENPVTRGSPAATARAIGSPLPPLQSLRRDLPPRLCAAIDAAVVPEPAERCTLTELGRTIEASLSHLDHRSRAPRARRAGGLARIPDRIAACGAADLAATAAIAGLTTATMLATRSGGPLWGYLLIPLVTLLGLLRPRLGYTTAAIGLCVWLSAAGLAGAAVVLAAIAIPPLLLVEGNGHRLTLPAVAPALGAVGLAPLYPALAGITGKARERLALGALGYAWLALAEVVLGRKLLFGAALSAPAGWQHSPSIAVQDLLLPLLTDPGFLFGVALWGGAALALGVLVRGRSVPLDLLGAVVWGAALIAAHRLRAAAVAPPPGVLVAALVVALGAGLVWRARRSPVEQGSHRPGPAPSSIGGAGLQDTLS